MPLDTKKILIVGGTGLLGQPVVRALDHFGFGLRVMSRHPDKAKKIFGKHFEIIRGDIEDQSSLLIAAHGCYGIHINLKGGPKPEDFDRIENQGTERIVRAATETGVKRITYLSGASVSPDRLWFAPTKAKFQAEQAIRDSGLEFGIFRATWFMESLPFFVRGKLATVMGKQPQKIHWISADDYAKMVATAFMYDEPLKETFIILGPEPYTFREALQIFADQVDPEIKISSIPIGILKFFAGITFSSQLKDILPLMEYYENNGELGDPGLADDLLGHPQTTLREWCALYQEKTKSVK